MAKKEMINDEIDKDEDVLPSDSPRIRINHPLTYHRSKTPNTKHLADKEIKITVIKTPRKKE